MENVNEKILEDYRIVVMRLDLMKSEITELERSNWKLRMAFNELLEVYQDTLDRFDSIKDRGEVEYHWCEKAGILD
jgi:chromosome segregation ATPase